MKPLIYPSAIRLMAVRREPLRNDLWQRSFDRPIDREVPSRVAHGGLFTKLRANLHAGRSERRHRIANRSASVGTDPTGTREGSAI
jgi:hypothetical protein